MKQIGGVAIVTAAPPFYYCLATASGLGSCVLAIRLNRDGKADILWQNTSTGQRVITLMNGTVIQSVVDLGIVPIAWSIAGSSDFNGDGKADILWQNTSTGQRVITLMNGTAIQSVVDLGSVATSWSIRNY